jgi:signal transduction histidine kinase
VNHQPRWPWFATVGVTAVGVAALVLYVLAGEYSSAWWSIAAGFVAGLISLAFGALIAVRRPGNRIVIPLIANAALLALSGLAEAYAQYSLLADPGALPGGEWAVLWVDKSWPLLFAPLVAIAFLFPDGKLPSPRWRPLAWVAGATFAGALVAAAFGSEPFTDPFASVDNPLPEIPGIAWLWPPILAAGLVTMFAGVHAIRVRFRRAQGQERLQLKWLAYSAFLIPVTLLVCVAFAAVGPGIDDSAAFTALFFVMATAIPTSVAIAVLRYRLYEIDRLINRTLVYGVVTVLLACAFAAATLLLGTAVGSDSSWATAGATLLVAVLFLPLRARVQDVVDRRFNRARYDSMRLIAAFLEDLRAGRAVPEAIEPMLRDVLDDPTLELRFWLPESQVYVDASGREPSDRPDDGRLRTPIARAGAPLGMVLHQPVDEDRPGLLAETVEAAGLAIEIVRLRVELRRQLEEVAASRARIVAAGDAERERLERDLHDGAQQRLVSIGLALRHAQHELGAGANGASPVLDDAVDQLAVRPAQLDGGLMPALRELAARSGLPVDVAVGPERYPADLETAAYFVASEALTNAVKHSGAERVTLRAQRSKGRLVLTVSDDGVGGASTRSGSGLRGLADRVEAHGGTLRLESSEGAGTTIVAELPCE